MTTTVPVGYLTLLQAAEMLLPALYAGSPDLPAVVSLRDKGIDVQDGEAIARAINEIWKAVDKRKLIPVAIGGEPRQLIKLDGNLTKEIPALRSPRGRGFSYSRPASPAYRQLTAWFGRDLSNVLVAFSEVEIRKLRQTLGKNRRSKLRTDETQKRRGRPSRLSVVLPVVRQVVEKRRWHPLEGLKKLANKVNRLGKWVEPVSVETIIRALDQLHEATRDRRFERVRRKPRTSR